MLFRSHAPTKHPIKPTTDLQRAPTEEDLKDNDENISITLPPERLAVPGDSCAICVDTLKDSDDVRGLTCGHAFHAMCVDPWLTSRRACCPLCKADYGTPKARPKQEGDSAGQQNASFDPRNDTRLNMPAFCTAARFRNARARTGAPAVPTAGGRCRIRNNHPSGAGEADLNQQNEPTGAAGTTAGMTSSVRQVFRFGRRTDNQLDAQSATDTAPQEMTPAQLDAGRASDGRAARSFGHEAQETS